MNRRRIGTRRVTAAVLAVVLLLFALAGCGQERTEGGAASPEEPKETTGAPLRAIFPIEEIHMNFPGGSGRITFKYEKEKRTAYRETVLQGDSSIPSQSPVICKRLECYRFTGDGLPETYSLTELFPDAAANDAPAESGSVGSGSDESGETSTQAGRMLFFRRFLYEDGQLSALLEEDLSPAREDGDSENTKETNKPIYKRLDREGSGYITAAALYTAKISPLEQVKEDFRPPDEDALTAEESYVIGAGGLPMEIRRQNGREKIFCTYTLDGRKIVRRQLRYEYDGALLWSAAYSYGYEETGRVSRIEWTITYEPGGQAPPAGALLPGEGSYSMTLRYAEGQPSYLAAVCEELRLGSLEQGYSADLCPPLLSPGLPEQDGGVEG